MFRRNRPYRNPRARFVAFPPGEDDFIPPSVPSIPSGQIVHGANPRLPLQFKLLMMLEHRNPQVHHLMVTANIGQINLEMKFMILTVIVNQFSHVM